MLRSVFNESFECEPNSWQGLFQVLFILPVGSSWTSVTGIASMIVWLSSGCVVIHCYGCVSSIVLYSVEFNELYDHQLQELVSTSRVSTSKIQSCIGD